MDQHGRQHAAGEPRDAAARRTRTSHACTVSWTADGGPPRTCATTRSTCPRTARRTECGGSTRRRRRDTLVPPGNHVPHTYAFYSVARDHDAATSRRRRRVRTRRRWSRTGVDDGRAWRLALERRAPQPGHVRRVARVVHAAEPQASGDRGDGHRRAARCSPRRGLAGTGPAFGSAGGLPVVQARATTSYALIQGERVLHDRVAVTSVASSPDAFVLVFRLVHRAFPRRSPEGTHAHAPASSRRPPPHCCSPLCSGCASPPQNTGPSLQEIAEEAYVFGFPLVLTDITTRA